MSIWACFEADAWSRGFSHKDYLDYKERSGMKHKALKEKQYNKLCSFLESMMKEDMKDPVVNTEEVGCDVDSM